MAAVQNRQKLAGCSGSNLVRARGSCSSLSPSLSAARARTAVHSAHSCYISCAHSAPHLSTTAGIVLLSCLSTRCLRSNFIMLSLSPLLSLYKSTLCSLLTLCLLSWVVHDPITLIMATRQPHLGAREGLEPPGSDLEGC